MRMGISFPEKKGSIPGKTQFLKRLFEVVNFLLVLELENCTENYDCGINFRGKIINSGSEEHIGKTNWEWE